MVPVGVYEGSVETAPACEREVGGQAKELVNAGSKVLAPTPPVCHADRGGLNG